MKKIYFFLVAFMLTMGSCHYYDTYDLGIPSLGPNSLIDENSPQLPDRAKFSLEGIYVVKSGNAMLGDTLVLKSTYNYKTGGQLSFFGKPKGVYAIMQATALDSLIYMEGYWRCAQTTETGAMRLSMKDGRQILAGSLDAPVTLVGAYLEGNIYTDVELVLVKRLTPSVRAKAQEYFIIGHRGGGRTSDRLPISENSVAMIHFTERFGTNGVEIDIQFTKDGVPVVYHDDDINIRLTRKGPLMGPVNNYTYSQLTTLVQLVHGETIPTLQEMLDAVLYESQLQHVWLDVKTPDVLLAIAPVQAAINATAKAMYDNGSRKTLLEVFMGLPGEDKVDAFMTLPGYQNIPSLCELTLDDLTKTNAKYWGPRWTRGPQPDALQQIHAQGKKAITWTLDDPNFMEEYVRTTQFDGILTNYPTLLSYYFYVYYNNK